MGHGEDRVGPVRVRGALVAVRDAAVGGHPRTELHDPLVGHLPYAHPVGAEAGTAVVEDGRNASEQSALLHLFQVGEELVLGDVQLLGGLRVRLGDDGHVALGGADHLDVELVVGLGLGLGRRRHLNRLGQRLGVPLHLEVHADLEQLERGELADGLGAGFFGERFERPVQSERRVGLGGDREPDVELVVAQVVVRDPGVRVDHVGGAPRVLGIDLGGDEHRRVAERARVEDRCDLADDPLVEQAAYAVHHVRFRDARLLCHVLVRPWRDREAALHEVQQPLVEIVERGRRAVLAGTQLGTEAGSRLAH